MPDVHAKLVIDAPVGEVWEKIKDFHDFSWAPEIVSSCEAMGEIAGNTPGSKRLINDALVDRLLEYDAGAHGFKYTIEQAPSPVSPEEISNFVGHLRLSEAENGKTLAEYSGSWDAPNEDAVEFMDGIYAGLLKELGQQFQS